MTAVKFRNTDIRLSETLRATGLAVDGERVTLRRLLEIVGEQGLLVFCAILGMPFMLPVTIPTMSVALGTPMLLIGVAVIVNRVPWLPARLLDHALPGDTVRYVLERGSRTAARFEHLVRPRWLWLTAAPVLNSLHGLAIVCGVLVLMAPLPLVPLANTLPALGIILLSLGLAERDGVVIALGYAVTLFAALFVGSLLYLAVEAGIDPHAAWQSMLAMLHSIAGG